MRVTREEPREMARRHRKPPERQVVVATDVLPALHAYCSNLIVFTNVAKLSLHFLTVLSGPSILRKYGPAGVEITTVRILKCGLLKCSVAPGRISAT